MSKITSNGNLKVGWVLNSNMTNPSAPILSDVLGGVDLTPAISWSDFTLGATGSDDVEDRGIADIGNSVSRGFANYEGALAFFREANMADVSSQYKLAYDTFKVPRTLGWIVYRVAVPAAQAWAAGDRVSVYQFIADNTTDDTDGDDSVKFGVNFLPQGQLYTNTLIKTAAPLLTTPATFSGAVGAIQPLTVTLSGKDVRSGTTHVSSNTAVATVSANGVIKITGTGSATVTSTHPAANATDTVAVNGS